MKHRVLCAAIHCEILPVCPTSKLGTTLGRGGGYAMLLPMEGDSLFLIIVIRTTALFSVIAVSIVLASFAWHGFFSRG
jgi:hypothetical protein